MHKAVASLLFFITTSYSLSVHAFSLYFESPVFTSNVIPKFFTCEGKNISPPLFWVNSSTETKSYVLIMEDLDGPNGIIDHWLIYNLSPFINNLPIGSPLPIGAKAGVNSFGGTKYQGPCLDSGTHQYLFKLYALDKDLNFPKAPTKQELLKAMASHITATSEFIVLYKK